VVSPATRQAAGAAGTRKEEQPRQKAVIEKEMATKMERRIHQATFLVLSEFLPNFGSYWHFLS
jgi:hypothetical protein